MFETTAENCGNHQSTDINSDNGQADRKVWDDKVFESYRVKVVR